MLSKKRGFTLIELLIVVAIIGIIAAIAVPNLLRSIQRAKYNRTFADLSAIATALGTYEVDFNHFPNAEGTTIAAKKVQVVELAAVGLPEEYYQGSFRDGWGNPLMYATTPGGVEYALISSGRDGDLEKDILHHSLWEGNTKDFRLFAGCQQISYENALDIIDLGCDLIYVNGQRAATLD